MNVDLNEWPTEPADTQKAVFRELLRLGLLKTDAIRAGDVLELDAIVGSEAGLLDKLAALGPINRINRPDDLAQTLEQLSQVNRLNERLLRIELDYVQEIRSAATGMVDSPAYDADGSLCLQRLQTANILNQIL